MFPLVLGVNFHEVFAIVVLVISVLSWIVNLIQGNNPNGTPRQQRPKPQPPTSRNELEELIQELTAEKRQPEKRPESTPPVRPRPERPRTQPATIQRPGSPPPYSASRQTPSPTVASSNPLEQPRPASNRIGSNVGESMRTHHVGTRIDSTAPQSIKADISQAVDSRLRPQMTAMSKPSHPLITLMQEPGGIQQAFILNEILQPPKSRR